MNVLIIAHDLPPLLLPQSIQIGRLLYHLPSEFRQYVATCDDYSCKHRDDRLYPGLYARFTDCLRIKSSGNFLVKCFKHSLVRLFLLPDVFIFWHIFAYAGIIRKWGKIKFDLIVTFSFPVSSSILGIFLRRYFKVRWVAFFSDPWADNPLLGYSRLSRLINSWLEKMVVKEADVLVFASQEMRDHYAAKYGLSLRKALCVEHSYDPKLLAGAALRSRQRLTLRYLGGLYGKRSALSVLQAIRNLVDNGKLKNGEFVFEIIGGGERRHMLEYRKFIRKNSLDGVISLLPAVGYMESLLLMKDADVLMVIDSPGELSMFLPSKLIDYIGSGRPVLAVTPDAGASSRVVKKTGGWQVSPERTDLIERTIKEIIEIHRQGGLEKYAPAESVKVEFMIANNVKKTVNIFGME